MINTIDMPVRQQPVESGVVIDPLLAARRNRDLMRVTAGMVALAIIVAVAIFCIFLPSPLPAFTP